MAAGIDEAAADEHHGRHLVELRELADGVEDHDVDARLGVDGELGAAGDAPARLLRQPLDLVEAFGLARRDDQQRVAPGRADPLERLEDRLLFAFQGRGGDHDRPIRRDPEVAQHPVAAAIGHRRPGISSESNFSEPVTDDAVAIGADLDDPPRRLLALHAEAIDVRQHAPEEAARQAVARERAQPRSGR